MIPDTSGQDRPLAAAPRTWRRRLPLLVAVAAGVVALVLAAPALQRMLAGERSVSAARLVIATSSAGRSCATSPAKAASSPRSRRPPSRRTRVTAELRVHAGDSVRKEQVLATIASPDLTSRLAQAKRAALASRSSSPTAGQG